MGRSPWLRPLQLERAEDTEKAWRAMERVGVAHLAERNVRTLSGGERQRVLLARALAQASRLLLLDEPTAHLDLAFQLETLELVRQLARAEGVAVLAVLHDVGTAAGFCDRLVMLCRGRIAAMGTPADVVTSETLRSVYGIEALVREHPVTHRPYVVPLAVRRAAGSPAGRVHVIAGGGSAGPLYARLLAGGWRVSTGVLNEGDSDLEAARGLGVEVVTAPPFSAIPPEAAAANAAMARGADAVVVAPAPWGRGNVANLRCAVDAAREGTRVLLVGGDPARDRDFTGGEAAALWREAAASGAAVATDLESAARSLSDAAGPRAAPADP
jgi:iron complex transport system ATP-binding protein